MSDETIVGYADLLSGDYPAPEPIIEGFVESGTVSNWSALWGTGKTWMALESALAVAAGTSFLCRFRTKQGKVLIVDQENTPGGMQARVKALAKNREFPADLPIVFAFLHGARLDDLEGFKRVDDLIGAHGPSYVVFDSWVRFMAVNENNAVAVALVNENVRSLVLRHGCAINILDHIRKPPPGGSDEPTSRTRGSGEKIGFVENALTMEKSREDRDVLIVHPLKRRYGELLAPFRVGFEHDLVTGAIALRYRGEATTGEVGRPGKVVEAVAALKTQWGEDAADALSIAGWLEWSDSTVRRVAKGMVIAGQLRTRLVRPASGRGANKVVYDVAEAP